MPKQMTMGVLVGNRGFFPSHLATSGPPRDHRRARSRRHQAHRAAPRRHRPWRGRDLRRREEVRRAVQGSMPPRSTASSLRCPTSAKSAGWPMRIRLADLRVPVLIQATPDAPGKMSIAFRRDSFCGKMSICNNLKQYGIPYSLTTLHTEAPDSAEFKEDLAWFAAVCRTVRGLKNVRFGAIGARPTAFNTVRYSEKLLERSGITVETLDLSEVMGRIGRMADNDDAAQAKLAAIKKYIPVGDTPEAALMKMAKLGAVIDHWMKASELTVCAVQCWTSIEEFLGIVPCTVMSMMSENLIPSACEVDVLGTLSHVRADAGQRDALRAARLEQQLRRGPQQGGLLPLLQPAQALLQRGREDGLPAHHRGHRGQGEHPRHAGRHREGRPDELRALLHRRLRRHDPRLRRRRRLHRRSAEHLRRRRRGRDSQHAGSCCATSARTASSTTSQPTSPPPPRRSTRPPASTSTGPCTGTSKWPIWRSAGQLVAARVVQPPGSRVHWSPAWQQTFPR